MMRTPFVRFGTAALAAVAATGSLTAQSPRIVSGERDGMQWVAQSRVVGVNSTDLVGAGGDARYTVAPSQSGVIAMLIETSGGTFICSGTLLPDRVSILTAAHCVTDGSRDVVATRTRIFFPGTTNVDALITSDPSSQIREVSNYAIHPNYTGEVIDQNDIAVLRLSEPAPASAVSYGIFRGSTLDGAQINVQGYGARSNVGGNFGANLGTGRLRQGQNNYDYRFGDSQFGGFFTDRDGSGENFFGLAEVEYSYVSDFDNGLAAQDASCRIAAAVGASAGFGCDLGRGLDEVGVAGGDSGGPSFFQGLVAGVTSYGLSFGGGFGDIRAGLNSSFGEFSGYVPTYIHADWIDAQVVPEPSTYALMATGLIGLGAMARRRRKN